jgi:nucleoside-diphosphate-sugar epimerase
MHLFVTGASGFVGTAVVAELVAAGHQVVGLARSQTSAARLTANGADVHRASLDDLDSIYAAAAAADGVLHLAYRHGAASEEAARTDLRVVETIGAALAGSQRPFVLTSGTLVLAPGHVGTECEPPDPAAPGAARIASEQAGLALANRGVRVAVVRLAPSVHDRVRRGFVGGLIDTARASGVSGYIGDGAQRWPTVHRADAARLYRMAVEHAPAGSILHGVGEQGVLIRDIADVIGAHLRVPVRPIASERAAEHFGWLANVVSVDAPASNARTRELLNWEPSHAGLLDDLANGEFFDPVER